MANKFNLKTNNYFDKMEYWATPFNPQPDKVLPDYYLPEQNLDTIVISNDKDKKPKSLGKKVAYTMAAIGAAVILVTKGASSSTAKKIIDRFNNLEIERLTSENNTVKVIDQTIEKTARKVRKALNFGNALANFTAIKDTFVHEFTSGELFGLGKKIPILNIFKTICKPIQSICDWFTKHIFKLTRNAVDSSYRKVGNSLDSLESNLRSLLKAKDIPLKEKAEIENLIKQITPTFKEGFDQTARDARFSKLEEGLKNLSNEVKAKLFGEKRDWKNLSSYVTSDTAKIHTNALQSELSKAKMRFSYNIEDVAAQLMKDSTELKNMIKPEDIETRKLLVDLFKSLKDYSSPTLRGSAESEARDKLGKKIIETLNSIKNKVVEPHVKGIDGGSLYTKCENGEIGTIYKQIMKIQDTINTSSQKGKLQEMLSIFKGLYGSESKEYKALKSEIDRINKALNNAIELEGTSMAGKYAETRVGSIPTDVMGIVGTAGAGAWAISKGKDKEEKVGATLKVGIPLLGSIGMYFFTAAKAISGVKNLALSLGAGFILNRIGNSIFNYYQKRFVENKSVQEIAKESYNEAISV